MSENETQLPALPVRIEAQAPRPSLARSTPTAAFVSQLLAARDRLPPQRMRRMSTPQTAIGAYGKAARTTVRRMPQGYRTTIIA